MKAPLHPFEIGLDSRRNVMGKNYDVTALGELLIDFTENGSSPQGNPLLEANPGGAPCNVLAMLNKLGHKTAFIGKVGKDMFGDQLETALKEVGIATDGLIKDESVHTTLAFVHTYADGDRDFSFYRKPGADMMLSETEVDPELIAQSRIFHFGTLSMTDEVCRQATKKALDIAAASGDVITFDPNLREPLWDSLDEAKAQVAYGMSRCHMLKISDNEIRWFTGKEDFDEGVACIRRQFPEISLILVTLGKDGSLGFSRSHRAFVKGFERDDTIETTGAGDTFCGSVIHYLLEKGLDEDGIRDLKEEELEEMLTFANAAASIITTRKGALRVMPEKAEIKALAGN
jgi:fructokinase